jgi:hypothetical protein
MKTKTYSWLMALAPLALCTLNSAFSTAEAQGTAFNYQGLLNVGSPPAPANGQYDFIFTLYANADGSGTPTSGPLTILGLGVTNGSFATSLDFGSAPYTGQNLWLQLQVRTNGNGTYADLAPLQPLLPTPYAIYAASAATLLGPLPETQLSGTYGNVLDLLNP